MASGSKLSIALSRKFPGAAGRRNLLRTLGVTMDDLLKPSTGGGSGQSNDPLQAMRSDLEGLLGKLGLNERGVKAVLEVLDAHAPTDELPDDDGHAKRAGELAGDDEKIAAFRDYLAKLGLSVADIDEALRLATAGGNGGAKDRLPVNAIFGGLGGRRSDNFRSPRDLAGDERRRAAVAADFDRRFPSAIVPGFDYGRPRSHPVTEAARADYDKRFPDAARIET